MRRGVEVVSVGVKGDGARGGAVGGGGGEGGGGQGAEIIVPGVGQLFPSSPGRGAMERGVLVFRARLRICILKHLPYNPHTLIGVIPPRRDRLLCCQVPFQPTLRAQILYIIFQRALAAQRTHSREVVLCGLEAGAQRGHEAEEGLCAGDGRGIGRSAFLVCAGRQLLGGVGPVGTGGVEGEGGGGWIY